LPAISEGRPRYHKNDPGLLQDASDPVRLLGQSGDSDQQNMDSLDNPLQLCYRLPGAANRRVFAVFQS
jgi:hypothetical protein